MKLSCVKVFLMAATLLLSACSGTTPRSCFSDACKLGGGNTQLNIGGGASLGNSYNEYGSTLLHD